MTRDEFAQLEVGNMVRYRGNTYTITAREHEYDYSTKPPTQTTWKVQFDNGQNAQINDDIRRLYLVDNLPPEPTLPF